MKYFKIAILIIAALIGLSNRAAYGWVTETSWYSNKETAGRHCADGRYHDLSTEYVAASWDYGFGTRLRVKFHDREVVVVVCDRGPAKRLYYAGRKLDLSLAAFKKLADPAVGVIDVNVERCEDTD